ncbi:MAG: hypothetical protein M3Z00_06800 [Actinomycetota bacterium]|nr:hypothetical protein [Actinomycetota bacterium]
MDPRLAASDALAAIEADLAALDNAPTDEQIGLYGRIHYALASALAGTATDPGTSTAAQPGQPPGG